MNSQTKSELANRYFFSRGPRASDEYKEFWIRYKPERMLRAQFGDRLTALWIISSVIAAIAVYLCLQLECCALIPVVLSFAIGLNFMKLRVLFQPTHIALNDEGLRLHWLRSFCNVSGRLVPWDCVTHVNIVRRSIFGGPQSFLEFNISGVKTSTDLSKSTNTDFSSGRAGGSELFAGSNQVETIKAARGKISFALNGVASSDDRKRLSIAMKKFLPSYRIDPKVSDELNLGLRVETYTDLWLDSLHAGAMRIRSDNLLCGEKLFGGRYEVIAELAAGGQAIVYEALDFGGNGGSKSVPRNVVLKEFVLPAHAGVSVRGRVLENIQREAKLLKSLKHPNIVKLLDFFVDDERAYLVLERIRGSNLKQLVEDKGALEEGQVVMFALQMCEILGYLHANNVVHRDFTPDNLILGHGDILKLIDFNVARQRENDSTKTVVGKHSYIPPEQFRGKAVPQSDLYAAGGTLHFLLTGLEPEPITSSQPRQFNAAISVELNRIVSKATALELGHRYPSCVELRADIQALKARYFDEI